MGEQLMDSVKTVKIDGEDIHIFNSAIYIFESSSGYTLELNMIVSEVVVNKYRKIDNVIVEIELEDGRFINTIMHGKTLKGGLPQLHLYCEIDNKDEFGELQIVNENESWFPNIEEGITLEEIRQVEMPFDVIRLKLQLPIDQIEWLKKQNKSRLNELISEMIHKNWGK